MTGICSAFSLSNFCGMFLNYLRKPEMIRTIGKKTEAPETSLACTSFYPFTQVLNKAIHILPSFFGTLLARYDIPCSSLTNVKVPLVGGCNVRGLSSPFFQVGENSTDTYAFGFQTLTNLKEPRS